MANEQATKGRRASKFACGTPTEHCNGHNTTDFTGKYHDDRASVLACQRRYLLKQGCTQITSRSFALPNDGPILVLSKKPQRLKPGKTSDRYMGRPLKVRDSTTTPAQLKSK